MFFERMVHYVRFWALYAKPSVYGMRAKWFRAAKKARPFANNFNREFSFINRIYRTRPSSTVTFELSRCGKYATSSDR